MTAFRHHFPSQWTTPLKLHQQGERGRLIVGEVGRELPFLPQRIFMVDHVAPGQVRGGHAHRECAQVLICTRGACRVTVDDGQSQRDITLEEPSCGLLIPPLHWVEFTLDSASAQLLVLASTVYDASDYISDYGEFTTLAMSEPWNTSQPVPE